MPIDGVVHYVDLATDKPLVKGFVAGIQHRIPGFEPAQMRRLFGPELFSLLDGIAIELVIFLNIGVRQHLGARVVEGFGHVLCPRHPYPAPQPRGNGFKRRRLVLSTDTQPTKG